MPTLSPDLARTNPAKLPIAYTLLSVTLFLQAAEIAILLAFNLADIVLIEALVACTVLSILAAISARRLKTGRAAGLSYWTLIAAIPLVFAAAVMLSVASFQALIYQHPREIRMLPLLIPILLWMPAYIFAARQRYLFSLIHRPTPKPAPAIPLPPEPADPLAIARLSRAYACLGITLTGIWLSAVIVNLAIWRLEPALIQLIVMFLFYAALAIFSSTEIKTGAGQQLSFWSLILMFPYAPAFFICPIMLIVELLRGHDLPWKALLATLIFTPTSIAYLFAAIQRTRLRHKAWPSPRPTKA